MSEAVFPRLRVICDDDRTDATGRRYHARGPRILGTYERREREADGAMVWIEHVVQSAKIQRKHAQWEAEMEAWQNREDRTDAEMPALTHYDGRRPFRGATARLLREDGTLVHELDRAAVDAARTQGVVYRSTGVFPADPLDLSARAVFVWRCPCGLDLILREEHAFPLFDAVGARGRKSVRLRELIDWTDDTVS